MSKKENITYNKDVYIWLHDYTPTINVNDFIHKGFDKLT